MPRIEPLRRPVTLQLDGHPIVAEEGEPAAVALVAAGRLALARSPKFHRPRGPTCLRGACDGCLARVDDVPNVMTCRVRAVDGMRIETQNVVGWRETDLLRMSDWFFPDGLNHHELLAGVPGLQRLMQALARRIAGLGRLPGESAPPRAAHRREADVLVVGAGPAGMSAALALSARGRQVEVVDDGLAWGGSTRAIVGAQADRWQPLKNAFASALEASRVSVRLQTSVAGLYGEDALMADDGGVEVVRARTIVLAPGAQDGVLAFEGNDVPGILSARAACLLLAHGVTLGTRVVATVAGGPGLFATTYAQSCAGVTLLSGTPHRVRGGGRVKEVTVETTDGEVRRLPCDALVIDTARSPSYELCAQAGGALAHEARGFVVQAAEGGRIRDGIFAIGEVVGTALEPEAMARAAQMLSERA